MGFYVDCGPTLGRAGIAKGRLYLRSRFGRRNHQFAINRTGVQPYRLDETGPIRVLVYQSHGTPTKKRTLIHPLYEMARRIEITIGTALSVAQAVWVRTSQFMTVPAGSTPDEPPSISASRTDFSSRGWICASCIPPKTVSAPCRPGKSDRLQLGPQPNPGARFGEARDQSPGQVRGDCRS